jgi:hypothetical protein
MGQRASDFFPDLETDIARWNLDEACLVVGRQIENAYNKGEDPWRETRAARPGLYKSAKQAVRKAIKKVKFNAKGIW